MYAVQLLINPSLWCDSWFYVTWWDEQSGNNNRHLKMAPQRGKCVIFNPTHFHWREGMKTKKVRRYSLLFRPWCIQLLQISTTLIGITLFLPTGPLLRAWNSVSSSRGALFVESRGFFASAFCLGLHFHTRFIKSDGTCKPFVLLPADAQQPSSINLVTRPGNPQLLHNPYLSMHIHRSWCSIWGSQIAPLCACIP